VRGNIHHHAVIGAKERQQYGRGRSPPGGRHIGWRDLAMPRRMTPLTRISHRQ
jgi:hypothetical protein